MITTNEAPLGDVAHKFLRVRLAPSALRWIFVVFLSLTAVVLVTLWLFARPLNPWISLGLSVSIATFLTGMMAFRFLRKMNDSYWSDTSQCLWIVLAQSLVLAITCCVSVAQGSWNDPKENELQQHQESKEQSGSPAIRQDDNRGSTDQKSAELQKIQDDVDMYKDDQYNYACTLVLLADKITMNNTLERFRYGHERQLTTEQSQVALSKAIDRILKAHERSKAWIESARGVISGKRPYYEERARQSEAAP